VMSASDAGNGKGPRIHTMAELCIAIATSYLRPAPWDLWSNHFALVLRLNSSRNGWVLFGWQLNVCKWSQLTCYTMHSINTIQDDITSFKISNSKDNLGFLQSPK
jgi:hypothetical protein